MYHLSPHSYPHCTSASVTKALQNGFHGATQGFYRVIPLLSCIFLFCFSFSFSLFYCFSSEFDGACEIAWNGSAQDFLSLTNDVVMTNSDKS